MIELECMGCKQPFLRRRADHEQNLKRGRLIVACSLGCVSLARYGPIPSSNCEYCGITFSRRKTTKDQVKFCSRDCAAKNTSESRKLERSCKFCGEKDVNYAGGVCQTCKDERKYTTRRRLNWNITTLASLRDLYGTYQYHAKLRGMSRSEYQKHKRPMICFVCSYELHVDVCHIRDIQDFPDYAVIAEVNNINNLVALCKNHHWEFDNGYLSL